MLVVLCSYFDVAGHLLWNVMVGALLLCSQKCFAFVGVLERFVVGSYVLVSPGPVCWWVSRGFGSFRRVAHGTLLGVSGCGDRFPLGVTWLFQQQVFALWGWLCALGDWVASAGQSWEGVALSCARRVLF